MSRGDQLAASAPGAKSAQPAGRRHREGPARSRHPRRSSRVRQRRSEVALAFTHIQQRYGRWCIVDLKRKHGRIRTAPMPTWVKVAINAWTSAAGIEGGQIFLPVNRADRVAGERLGEKVVWEMLQLYAEAMGLTGIAPHDLRRTGAKLCRAAGGELEQIQLLLGHASIRTIGRYLGTKRDLVDCPGDTYSSLDASNKTWLIIEDCCRSVENREKS